MRGYVLLWLSVISLLMSGCLTINPPDASVVAPPPQIRMTAITPTAAARPGVAVTGGYQPQDYPGDLVDALPVMSGICFEAAHDAAGEVFVLHSADAHSHLYDLADNAGLCRQPVTRHPFDFSQGAVLAGGWSRGTGCTARHEVTRYERSTLRRTITIETRFITEGDCPYELVRPFWVGIPGAQGDEIRLTLDD